MSFIVKNRLPVLKIIRAEFEEALSDLTDIEDVDDIDATDEVRGIVVGAPAEHQE